MSELLPDSLVSSGIRDKRNLALARAFGVALAQHDPAALLVCDPMTCDARFLPALIVERGAKDLIDPSWPEHVQRRILANIYQLKTWHGYDAGVKLGLRLLGMAGHIQHWHQMEPRGPANTQRVTFYIGERLYPNSPEIIGPGEIAAADRMIAATKRHSQATELRVGLGLGSAPRMARAVAPPAMLRRTESTRQPLKLASRAARLSMLAPPVALMRLSGAAA